jgi:hypothetical protein
LKRSDGNIKAELGAERINVDLGGTGRGYERAIIPGETGLAPANSHFSAARCSHQQRDPGAVEVCLETTVPLVAEYKLGLGDRRARGYHKAEAEGQ